MEDRFKRQIAFKMRINEISLGNPIFDNERFSFLELGNKKISRVNLIGNITDKFESEGEKKYLFLTLDDGSGQIRLKIFGDDLSNFKDFSQGDTVLVVGRLRNWNNEFYIQPEIIKIIDQRYLLVRKLELENKRSINLENKDGTKIARDRIINKIKDAEDDGGIDRDKLILEINDVSPSIINQEIHKLLEEGIIFEPRPGRVRYLG